jgi:hypothetical protein
VRLTRKATTALRALLVLAVALALMGAESTASIAGETGASVIAKDGFGERENSFAWSMGWFKHKLYVGTGRDVLCVENETTQFFVPLEQKYSTTPSLNVRCPANPYEMDLRANIWQYTPNTHTWKRVYIAPTENNPKDPNLSVSKDIAYRGMLTYAQNGREALFAAGVSADEYLPPLLTKDPPRILRSFDGKHWQPLNLPVVTVHFPEGNIHPMGFRSLVVWKGHLYVTATPDLTGNGSLFEITNAMSSHPGLVQVTPPSLNVFEAVNFHGDLYVGCGSEKSGYSVWEASGEGQPWVPIVTGGAGRGDEITSVVSMHVFHDALYVGASGWYQNTLPQSELIRVNPEGQWTLVVGNPRKLPSGQTAYPTSGLDDGFDSTFNAHFWRMGVFGGGLYVGTNSWANLVKGYKGKGWAEDLLADASGYQVWATCDGEDWYPVTRDAFGDGEYNFGARNFVTGYGPSGEELYIGSANIAGGTTIVDYHESICSSGINKHGVVSAPSAMIAESAGKGASKGTLLSWKPSPSAARYRVLAASTTKLTLYLQPQPSLTHDAFQFEGAQPIVSSPETPGAVPVSFSLPGEFESIATTSDPYFVAHSSAHRVYEVVAETASGEQSDPSNIQIVPTPEPAATFGSVQAAIGSSAAGNAMTARAASASSAQRLLDAARSAWARGQRPAALRDVQRLQSLAGAQPDQLSALAARLERRLLYGEAAGEP